MSNDDNFNAAACLISGQAVKPPLLNGKAVKLRAFKESDIDAIAVYRQDEAACQFIRPAQSREEIMAHIEHHCQPWLMQENRWNGFIICRPNDEEAIGEILFRITDADNQRAEVGYRVTPACYGQGYATEALGLMIDYLFELFPLHKIVAKCDPLNIGSYRVMEKVGMVREAHFKSHFLIGTRWSDQVDYGILKDVWCKKTFPV